MERLADNLEAVARSRIKVAGVLKATRRELDFTSTDASVVWTATDDAVNEKVTVNVAVANVPITSGALPTQTFASGTAAQVSTTRPVNTHTPVTFNPLAGAAATCKVELSPDNVTYSTLVTRTIPLGVVFDGTIQDVAVRVPTGWYLKLTVVNAVLGTTTYY